ncbi:MAG: DUF721 domain-containing protein [Betaproteobacteria bacterium]|nr:DUF721 domain-containing protein [Betaproteobacteria bacterium]
MTDRPEHFLDSDAAAGRVMAHARLLLALDARLRSAVPKALAPALRVANFKSGRVVIHAETGAAAARIRQMDRRLCDELSKQGPQCTGLDVKVQPSQIPCQSRGLLQKPLSARACGELSATAGNLPPGRLRDALARLLERSVRQG